MRHKPQAFTRLELLAVIIVLSLLGAFTLPLLATTRRDSDHAACFNNLRQLGRAVLLWAGDHGERAPWWTPTNEGGSFQVPKAGSAWFEWATLKNELVTPRILACPADTGVRVAAGFDSSSTGFFNTGMRANALSYIVDLHAFLDYPDSIVSADRNLHSDAYPVACSTGVNNADAMYSPFFTAGWTNAVHGTVGHVLLIDGRVELMSSERFQALIKLPSTDQFASRHFLRAR